jgi:hypothetical protein
MRVAKEKAASSQMIGMTRLSTIFCMRPLAATLTGTGEGTGDP